MIALCKVQGFCLSMAASDAVARALMMAAQRAERHAVLESAHASIEKITNFTMPPETLSWGAALFFV